MKTFIFWITLLCLGTSLLCIQCKRVKSIQDDTFSPDHFHFNPNEDTLHITNRAKNELWEVSKDFEFILKQTSFPTAINDLYQDKDTLWIITDGPQGMMYKINEKSFSTLKKKNLGHTPSSILFNPKTNTLWVTMRHHNEIWEINPDNLEVLAMVKVGREPVKAILNQQGQELIVAHNLPEQNSLAHPVNAQLYVVDTDKKQVTKQIPLINGATDVRDIVSDKDAQYAYIPHLIARYQLPTNQVDRGWMSTNAFSILDLNKMEIITSILLDTPQKGAANPSQIILTPNNETLIIALSGVHELSFIDLDKLYQRLELIKKGESPIPSIKTWEDIPNDASILHGIQTFISTQGKGPRALVSDGKKVYTGNYFTANLFSYDLENHTSHNTPFGRPMTDTAEGRGNMYFHDATLCFQQWQSCSSCHPNEARLDGLNWDLLNDGMGNSKNTKSLIYAHETAPCMVTGIRKNAEAAVRSGFKYILFAQVDDSIPTDIDAYLRSLKTLSSPYVQDKSFVSEAYKGKALFDKNCAQCHSGLYLTNQKQVPISWSQKREENTKFDVPTLKELWRSAPYLYDGRAYTLDEVIEVHNTNKNFSAEEQKHLKAYLLSL